MVRRKLTAEEMSHYKEELIEFDLIRNGIDLRQAADLLNEYTSKWNTATLAEKWGVKNYKIYDLRKIIRKEHGNVLAGSARGRKIGDKNKKVETVKKKTTTNEEKEKKPIAERFYEDRIKELEILLARQETELLEKDRVIEEAKQEEALVSSTSSTNDDMKAVLELMQEQSEQVVSALYGTKKEQETLNGIAFKFEGEYTANALKKRLEKVIHILEGETSTFEISFHILENGMKDIAPEEVGVGNFQKQLDDLTLTVLSQEEELQKVKEGTEVLSGWQDGYNSLKKDEKLYSKEFKVVNEENIPARSYITRHGIKCFQSFYHCPKCKDRDKTFTPKGSQYVNCKKCGEGMPKRDASSKGFPEVDSYGNIYIAGDFEKTLNQ